MNENELHDSHMNKSEVFESASDSSVNESEEDNNQVNDRYKAGEGYHAVPPPYIGNFMPPRPDLSFAGLDDSVFKSVDQGIFDSRCSRHMTGNKFYLSYYQDINGGFWKDWKDDQATRSKFERLLQQEKQIVHPNSTNSINTVSTLVSATGPSFTNDDPSSPINVAKASNAFKEHLFERFSPFKNAFTLPPVSNVFLMDDTGIFGNAYDDKDVRSLEDFNEYSNKESDQDFCMEHAMRSSWIEAVLEVLLQFPTSEGLDLGFLLMARGHWNQMESFRKRMMREDYSGYKGKTGGKSVLLYGTIDEEVYVCQPPGFEDPQFPDKVYKVEKALYCLHQAPRACQDKYVADILKKFDLAIVKTASTPMEPNKALIKDKEADSVYVHLYRSMIGSLMYLTASRPDIMFVVCACARFKGCQFLGKRLISWQCKKQTIVANSTTEAEYVDAANYETVYKEWEDRVKKAATTASSLDAEQNSGNIKRTQSMATLNVHDLLLRGYTLRSGEDSIKLLELMELCTNCHIWNYLKGTNPLQVKVKIYSENDPTSGIRACVETLNKKNSINLAFLSSKNISCTNEVSTASGDFEVSTAGGITMDEVTWEEFDLKMASGYVDVKIGGIMGKDLIVTMEEHAQQMNFITRHWWLKWLGGYDGVLILKSSDEENTPANDRFSKVDGKTNEVNIEKSKSVHESVVSKLKINRDKVIIEDWNSDDEDDVSAVKIKEGIGFKKIKACFVCKSSDHLIKDCDFYAKKSPEPKVKTVVNTGKRVVKPVWDNAKRVNQQKISNNLKYPQARRTFVPSGVLTRTGLVNPVRPNGKRAVHTVSTARPVSTARKFAPKIAQTGSAIRPIYPRMDNVRPRASYSPIKRSYYTKPAFRPKDLKQDVKTSRVKNMTTAGTRAVVNTGKGKMDNDLKKSRWVWRPKGNYMDHGNPESILQDHAVVDSGCSSHMTGNKAYLSDYKDYNGGFVAFGSDPKGGKITGKGKIRTANLDFDDVYFVDELKFNLFSVSQMCDKKNSVLFTDTECLILSPSFKLLDENQVVLRAPRQNGVYSLDLKNIVPSGGITCLYANATTDIRIYQKISL
ncbi:ribonuclease H-like domain-containing protein [Tanacetum coccineum]